MNQASSLTTENSSETLPERRIMKREKEYLTRELEELTKYLTKYQAESGGRNPEDFETKKKKISDQITRLETALSDNSVIEAFNSQKAKNQQIVHNCQQLLAKLRE
jgi:hypothetical protein